MAEKYQIGKNAAFLQILAIIHVLMCLMLTRGKPQSSFGKKVISCMTQVPSCRCWDPSQLALFICPIFAVQVHLGRSHIIRRAEMTAVLRICTNTFGL